VFGYLRIAMMLQKERGGQAGGGGQIDVVGERGVERVHALILV
jgi:preprotein translocase subunit SecG